MKRIVFFCILFLFCLYPLAHYFAVPKEALAVSEIDELNAKIAEKKEKIKLLESSIENYKKEIAQKKLDAKSLSNQIAILDNHTEQVEMDIKVTQERLDTLELEIESVSLQISEKENSVNKQRKILAELLRTINRSEQKKAFEVFVAYDNFSDFYNQLQYVKTIERDLGKTAKNVRLDKEDLEVKRKQKEDIKTSFENTKEELQAQKEALVDQVNIKSNLLSKTHASEATYQVLLTNLRSQYQQIEAEISGIEQDVRKRLEAEKKLEEPLDAGGSIFSWPVPSKYITATFHDPDYPYRNVFEHSGIDIRAGQGTSIKAAASGYVARAKYCSSPSCYSFVMIIHSDGLSTVYGHMSSIYVKEDAFVARGDVIGLSGGTPGTNGAGPFVTGPHLHFEVRRSGVPVNPLNYLSQ